MVSVTIVRPSGESMEIEVSAGQSIMECAVRAGIDGIDAECGGQAVCATCHVHVAREWVDKLPRPDDQESAMLENAIDRDDTSRLSCQLFPDETMNGLTVRVPETQF